MSNLEKNNYLNNQGKESSGITSTNTQGNNPREFMWSATAVSFAALMAVLQSYTEMRKDQMLISNQISTEIANATITEGQAQVDAGNAQAQGTQAQGYGSLLQACGSGVGIIGSGYGAWKAASAGSVIKPMTDLVEQADKISVTPPTVVGGSPTQDQTVSNLQDQLMKGKLTADQLIPPGPNNGLKVELDRDINNNPITLESLLQTATDQNHLSSMKDGLSKTLDKALSNYQNQQTYANNIISTFQSFGSLIGSAGGASASSRQAASQQSAALAQQDVTYAAGLQQFSNTTYGNIRQAASYADQGVSSTFSFILNMQNNDMRG